MAERMGFEPTIPFLGYTPLAGERLQPLGHLSTAGNARFSGHSQPTTSRFDAADCRTLREHAQCSGTVRSRGVLVWSEPPSPHKNLPTVTDRPRARFQFVFGMVLETKEVAALNLWLSGALWPLYPASARMRSILAPIVRSMSGMTVASVWPSPGSGLRPARGQASGLPGRRLGVERELNAPFERFSVVATETFTANS